MAHSARFVALVDAARRRVMETTPEAVRTRQASGEALTLVDVREDREWQAGRIPGAVHLGRGIIERDAEANLPDLDATIVLYCGGGYRSALSADSLRQMGYTAVESMDGGIRRWRELGYDEDTAAPEV